MQAEKQFLCMMQKVGVVLLTQKKKTEEIAEKTSKYTMGRGAAFDGPFIKIHLTMLFDRQYMRVLMGLTVSRKICSRIVSIIV